MYSWACGLIIIVFSLALGEELDLSKARKALFDGVIDQFDCFYRPGSGDGKIDLASTAPSIAAIYWIIISSKNPLKI